MPGIAGLSGSSPLVVNSVRHALLSRPYHGLRGAARKTVCLVARTLDAGHADVPYFALRGRL